MAAKAAKSLIGQFPNLRADDPGTFNEAVALVLAQYPLGLVQECCDPRVGLASAVDWLTLKTLSDWLRNRMDYYAKLARYEAPPQPRLDPPADPTMAERVRTLLTGLAAALRAKGPSPLDRMHEEVAAARRLRIEEVMRRAYEPQHVAQQPAKEAAE